MRSLPGDCFLGRGFDIDFFYQYQPDSAPCCKLLFTLLTPFTLLAPLNTVKNSFGAKKLYLIWLYGFMGFRAKKRMDGELDGKRMGTGESNGVWALLLGLHDCSGRCLGPISLYWLLGRPRCPGLLAAGHAPQRTR